MHSPSGSQQLAETMSGLQLTENPIKTECANETGTSVEEGIQQRLEPEFPHTKLATLDEKISSPRWVVPVLPDQELECLLQASIDLCKKGKFFPFQDRIPFHISILNSNQVTTFSGIDVHSEACQRFFREGLTISFTKILTDDAVNSWKLNIHNCINANCERLVELCILKLEEDWFPLLDLLAMVFNPNNK